MDLDLVARHPELDHVVTQRLRDRHQTVGALGGVDHPGPDLRIPAPVMDIGAPGLDRYRDVEFLGEPNRGNAAGREELGIDHVELESQSLKRAQDRSGGIRDHARIEAPADIGDDWKARPPHVEIAPGFGARQLGEWPIGGVQADRPDRHAIRGDDLGPNAAGRDVADGIFDENPEIRLDGVGIKRRENGDFRLEILGHDHACGAGHAAILP